MNTETVLEDLEKREIAEGLDDIYIKDIPVWALLKHKLRNYYMIIKGVADKDFRSISYSLTSVINIVYSLLQLIALFISKKRIENFVMGFSRFEKVGDVYYDKYTDPLLEMTDLKNSYLYVEYGYKGHHHKNRPHYTNRLYSDAITHISEFLGFLLTPIFLFLYWSPINRFCQIASNCLTYRVGRRFVSRKLVSFKVSTYIYICLLKRHKVKRVFGVSRVTFRPVAFSAKKLGLTVYELQHGITMNRSTMYMGKYNADIDPDFFLLFGDICPLNVFGIPPEKTKIIGWAFNNYIASIKNVQEDAQKVLFISSSETSDKILQAASLFKKLYPYLECDIRRHPMEVYNKEQMAILIKNNLKDVSSTESSSIAIMPYKYIVGDISTVLYEALDLGKIVARLNICGLSALGRSENDGFYYIDNESDIDVFLNGVQLKRTKNTFSNFDINQFNKLLI